MKVVFRVQIPGALNTQPTEVIVYPRDTDRKILGIVPFTQVGSNQRLGFGDKGGLTSEWGRGPSCGYFLWGNGTPR